MKVFFLGVLVLTSVFFPGFGLLKTSALAAESPSVSQEGSAKDELLHVCAAQEYVFTPKLRRAFLAYARQEALASLELKGKELEENKAEEPRRQGEWD